MSRTVLVVQSSGRLAKRLEPLFSNELKPAGDAVTPLHALDAVRRLNPTLLLIEVDGEAPDVTRLVERVMSDAPRPIMLLVASPQAKKAAFTLLNAGALDVVQVPETLDAAAVTSLRRQISLLAGVRVVQHPRGRRRRTSSGILAVRPDYPLVAIAASLGGPRALAEVLSDLPRDFPAPVVICQHITPGFSDDLAIWLGNETGHRVHEATDGQRLVKGEVFLSPAHLHMLVHPSGVIRLDDGPMVGGFKPSCDVLLKSVAHSFGPKAIGVVLTGMGRDGAQGLKEIRAHGGHTIAQDEETSIVFGMPGEAVQLGAAELVLPLEEIGDRLVGWVS